MRIHRMLLCFLLVLAAPLEAAQVCAPVDWSAWTDGQRAKAQAVAYNLAVTVGGQDVQPTLGNNQVCFQDPTFDVPATITAATLLARLAALESAEQEARTTAASKVTAQASELSTNDLCTAGLETVDSKIDALINGANTATEIKAAVKVALKRIARCLVAQPRGLE